MSLQSEKVKRWRKLCKQKIITAMGGKCCVCGYNRCQEALSLHHLDPSKKDFSIAAVRARPKAWVKIVEELQKCVLVCSVCHTEIHYGVSVVPENAPSFDKNFSNFSKIEDLNKNTCKVCKDTIPVSQKYCSYECSGKARYRVDWNNVDLVALISQKSILQIAEELGCSDGAVHKRLKKLGLKN